MTGRVCVRFVFVDRVAAAIGRVERATIGLAFVLACQPAFRRSLSEGQP